ncbi:hypothetical protein B0H10DRAFT_1958000 [Mycena sp. CBHHK59/15]|nr:hypothetical protein B0H10DRAFT_1958000 [Mycena sp. CBHHK59/15]
MNSSFVHKNSSGAVGSPVPVLDLDSSCADEDTQVDSGRWHVEDAAHELVPHEEEQLVRHSSGEQDAARHCDSGGHLTSGPVGAGAPAFCRETVLSPTQMSVQECKSGIPYDEVAKEEGHSAHNTVHVPTLAQLGPKYFPRSFNGKDFPYDYSRAV